MAAPDHPERLYQRIPERQREPFLILADTEQLELALLPESAASALSAEHAVLSRLPAEEMVSALRALPHELRLASNPPPIICGLTV